MDALVVSGEMNLYFSYVPLKLILTMPSKIFTFILTPWTQLNAVNVLDIWNKPRILEFMSQYFTKNEGLIFIYVALLY